MISALLVAASLSSSCSTSRSYEKQTASALDSLPSTTLSSVDFAFATMVNAGVDNDFAKKIETQFLKEKENAEIRDKIVSLNVLGFLSPGDYSKHYSLSAVKHIKGFLKKYRTVLSRAEKDFQVPRETVASLLWVETKHGKTMGNFSLPVVYFSLLQANHPMVAKNTLLELNRRRPASNSSSVNLSNEELQQKVIQRSINKSKWALEQIKILEQLSNKQALNQPGRSSSRSMLSIRSSFAGAFGCSQFIPSSYEKYAVSFSKKKTPNLFDMKDCIFSVANFLHKSGWDSQNPKAQSDALFEYNRIRDYGDVIQKLATAAHQA